MSRVHIALNTHEFEQSLAFYSALFGADAARIEDDWAKFDVEDPAVNLTLNRCNNEINPQAVNHFGIELGSADAVTRADQRLKSLGMETLSEHKVQCCYATQEKTWVRDPNGHSWELFYVYS